MLNFKKFRNKKKGFTLIELIVVIAIIGILAAILLPRFGGFTDKAREKSAMSEAKGIYTYLESEYAEKGQYPAKKEDIEAKNKENIVTYIPTATGDNPLFTYKIEGKKEVITCTASGNLSKTTTIK